MPDYKDMYVTMVRASEKAITLTEQMRKLLIDAQRDCEELYINSPDPIIRLVGIDIETDRIYTKFEKGKGEPLFWFALVFLLTVPFIEYLLRILFFAICPVHKIVNTCFLKLC